MFFKIFVIAVLSMIYSGCTSHMGLPVKMYQGVDLTLEQEAMIQGTDSYRLGSTANEVIRIVEVDGVKVPRNGTSEGADIVRITPGYHIVKVLYVHGARNGIDYYTYDSLPIKAAPNCTYQIVAKFDMTQSMIALSWLGFSSSGGQDYICERSGREYLDQESEKPFSI